MNCPHCRSLVTTQLANKTSLGYRIFLCSECGRKFNERTGTAYNHLQFAIEDEVDVQTNPKSQRGRECLAIAWCCGLE